MNKFAASLGFVMFLSLIGAHVVTNLNDDYHDRQGPMIQKLNNLPDYNIEQDLSPNSFVPLVRLEDTNGEFFCSGTVISNDYVLTAAHCLVDEHGYMKKELNVVSMVNKDNQQSKVLSVAAGLNRRADYGLVKGDFSYFMKLKLQFSPLEEIGVNGAVGRVMTCGFPWGVDEGVCYPAGNQMHRVLAQDAVAGILYPGMSGGPVIDFGNGKVFAVNTAVSDGYIIVSPLVGLFKTLGIKVK